MTAIPGIAPKPKHCRRAKRERTSQAGNSASATPSTRTYSTFRGCNVKRFTSAAESYFFLIEPTRDLTSHDQQRIVGQWPTERFGLVLPRTHQGAL
jgi:hypothetical protein